MPCVNPKIVAHELLPCGTCIGCRREIALDWKWRCLGEMQYHKDACFLTLTYNDEHVEELNKRAFQLFMKMLRYKTKLNLKYYACGEYGGLWGRPHYHAIVFGLASDNSVFQPIPNTSHVRCDLWQNGFVYVGTVTPKSVTYVTGYITKALPVHLRNETIGSLAPPFRLMSKGLGEKYFNENMEKFAKTLSMTYEGVHYRLPRNWQKLLKIQYPETKDLFYERAIVQQQRKRIDLINATGSLDPNTHQEFEIENLKAIKAKIEAEETHHTSNKLRR